MKLKLNVLELSIIYKYAFHFILVLVFYLMFLLCKYNLMWITSPLFMHHIWEWFIWHVQMLLTIKTVLSLSEHCFSFVIVTPAHHSFWFFVIWPQIYCIVSSLQQMSHAILHCISITGLIFTTSGRPTCPAEQRSCPPQTGKPLMNNESDSAAPENERGEKRGCIPGRWCHACKLVGMMSLKRTMSSFVIFNCLYDSPAVTHFHMQIDFFWSLKNAMLSDFK